MVFWNPSTRPVCECRRRGMTCNCTDGGSTYADVRGTFAASGLEFALMELERAAWSRSWSQLKAAREKVKAATGIELKGKLTREKHW